MAKSKTPPLPTPPPDPNVIRAEDYWWEELSGTGLLALLAWLGTATVVREIRLQDSYNADARTAPDSQWAPKGREVFGSYGTRLREVTEGALLSDGRVLLCCTVSEWGGTFASHDDIKVQYYGLRPKLPTVLPLFTASGTAVPPSAP